MRSLKLVRRGWLLTVEVTLLAIGIMTAVLALSAARGGLSASLRVQNPARTYFVGRGNDQIPDGGYADLLSWSNREDIFSHVGAFSVWGPLVVETESRSVGVEGAWVARSMTSFLPQGVEAGRPLHDGDFASSASNVLVSEGLLSRLDCTVGSVIRTSWGTFQIVGVLPSWARFPYPVQPDIIIPTSPAPTYTGTYTVLGEIRAGLTREQAERSLNATSQDRGTQARNPVRLVPIQASLDPAVVSVSEYGLVLGLLTLSLLVATASLIELLDAIRGGKERAIKFALGASLGRLALERALDVLIICSLATGIGVFLVGACQRLIAHAWSTQWVTVPRIDALTFVWLGALLVFSCLTVSIAPMLVARSTKAYVALKEERASSSKAVQRARLGIIVLQVAASVAFGFGAARLAGTLHALATEPLGIQVANVWDGSLDLRTYLRSLGPAKGTNGQYLALQEQLRDRLQSLPGVAEVAFSSEGPGAAVHELQTSGLAPRGAVLSPDNSVYWIPATWVDSNYLQLLGCRLVAGRYFTSSDLRQPIDEGGSVILSEPLARKLFGVANAVGKEVAYPRSLKPNEAFSKVVGVVTGMRTLGLEEPMTVEVFQPLTYPPTHLALRMKGGATVSLMEVQQVVSEVLPGSHLESLGPLRQRFDTELSVPRQRLSLLAFFATISAAVAAFGLASVLLVIIKERDLEIGIRRALGASNRDLASALLKPILPWVAVAVAVGLLLPILFPAPLGIGSVPGLAGGIWSSVLATAAMLFLIVASLLVPLRRALRRPISDLLRAE